MKFRINACALALFILFSQVTTVNAADSGSPVVVTPTPKIVVDELALSRSLIASKNYRQALTELARVDQIVINNADVNNLLGFASRKLGKYGQSGVYYMKALEINPAHLGALEYQGELFLIQKKVTLAQQNLAKLKRLCGTSCEEYLDLKQAIAVSTKKK